MDRLSCSSRQREPHLDERGVALPLALFGLVAVSLLVTSALVTSSTEVALSRAHQEGTRALYAADAALEEFVAERATMVLNPNLRLASGSYPIVTDAGDGYTVSVAELFLGTATPLPNGNIQRRETYSLVAEPQNGVGRAVGALVEATRMASSVSFDIDSGLTVGMNTTVTGNATISDGSSGGAPCDSASATAAIRHADGTTITQQGGAHDIYGNIIEDERSADQLMSDVLNGHSLDEISDLAHIKFGPMFGEPSFTSGAGPRYDASNADYRWGCPAQLITGCPAAEAAYYPTVVIDANGSEVNISNYHGQGVLVVRNGSLHIDGSFKFGGIILIEGSLRVSGGGAGEKKLEGAIVAMGDESIIDPGTEGETTGNSLIRYNQCLIVEAQRGLTMQTLNTANQTIDSPTFAWFEVLR